MGYFSNGTEAEAYQAKHCAHCALWSDEYGCPCWDAHMFWNGEECNKPDSILHKMIPQTPDGLGNKRCAFFCERENEMPENPERRAERLLVVRSQGQIHRLYILEPHRNGVGFSLLGPVGEVELAAARAIIAAEIRAAVEVENERLQAELKAAKRRCGIYLGFEDKAAEAAEENP